MKKNKLKIPLYYFYKYPLINFNDKYYDKYVLRFNWIPCCINNIYIKYKTILYKEYLSKEIFFVPHFYLECSDGSCVNKNKFFFKKCFIIFIHLFNDFKFSFIKSLKLIDFSNREKKEIKLNIRKHILISKINDVNNIIIISPDYTIKKLIKQCSKFKKYISKNDNFDEIVIKFYDNIKIRVNEITRISYYVKK